MPGWTGHFGSGWIPFAIWYATDVLTLLFSQIRGKLIDPYLVHPVWSRLQRVNETSSSMFIGSLSVIKSRPVAINESFLENLISKFSILAEYFLSLGVQSFDRKIWMSCDVYNKVRNEKKTGIKVSKLKQQKNEVWIKNWPTIAFACWKIHKCSRKKFSNTNSSEKFIFPIFFLLLSPHSWIWMKVYFWIV